MSNNIQIISNFLNKKDFLEIKNFIMSPRCQWRYVDFIAHKDKRDNDKDGYFATTSTTIEAVKNNIRNLLNTNQGERLFQPNLGVNLRRYLFSQITDETLISIQDSITSTFSFWLPFVNIQNISLYK